MNAPAFTFGQHVRKIGNREVWLVLGWDERTKRYQIAQLNNKSDAKPDQLELA